MHELILPTAYLAPMEWYEVWWEGKEKCKIEVMESYEKQTYRNRCTITTPHGPLSLTVPVRHTETKQLTRDVEISYQTRWQHQHWIALVSAYKRTPYFDYYMDFLQPMYEKEVKYLVDWNDELHEIIAALLENKAPERGTRTIMHTTDWAGINLEKYFGKGVSILDGLMEYGPEWIVKRKGLRAK